MAEEAVDLNHEIPADPSPAPSDDPVLTRTSSSSRLNARAPEFVPRAAPPPMVKIHHHGPPPPPSQAMIHVYHAPAPSPPQFIAPVVNPGAYDYFVGGGFGAEQEVVQSAASADLDPPPSARDGLSDEVIQKITKQVEYYFSDANLATTEHLMRFISKDPDGFVPMSVIASFKKIKALVHNNSLLADALRKSSKLAVSEDGKKVRRQHPITEADVEELQSLMKIFSVVGSVKSIRTCYPQTPNGTSASTNRATKMDMLFGNRVAELNDERNWRSGLRVRLLHRCMSKHGAAGRNRKGGHEGDGNGEEEDVSTSNQPHEKLVEDFTQPSEASNEHVVEEINDKEDGVRRGKGRGRGGRG
ncbi:hypothetical protein J5N97_015153 [Dioscorea zingiberensis]|uniref:HTH La-type RNA-binding domain-containing protein n=1 Tax=Dioscorea zingiberensis TaxID=325984 RepID=A0A9D5CVI9_9LILI|nr:hypothetical protein J5N97_015153 [Dioscorea zingiberensis]